MYCTYINLVFFLTQYHDPLSFVFSFPNHPTIEVVSMFAWSGQAACCVFFSSKSHSDSPRCFSLFCPWYRSALSSLVFGPWAPQIVGLSGLSNKLPIQSTIFSDCFIFLHLFTIRTMSTQSSEIFFKQSHATAYIRWIDCLYLPFFQFLSSLPDRVPALSLKKRLELG